MYKIKLKIESCNKLKDLGDFIRSQGVRIVLFGEYHGFSNQIQVQRKLIKHIRPDFVLYEMLEETKILADQEAKKFLSKVNSEEFSVISTYGQLKPIVRLARAFDLSLIGCDIKNMGCKNKKWRKKGFSYEEGKRLTAKRELRQANVIKKYSSKGLIFGIVGAYHLRKGSFVLSKLKNKKAVIVKPLFKWEDRFSYREKFKDSEISYECVTNFTKNSKRTITF